MSKTIVGIVMSFVLAAGMCGGSGDEAKPKAEEAGQAAEKPADNSAKIGEADHPNKRLGNMKNQLDEQAEERTKKLDKKIESGY